MFGSRSDPSTPAQGTTPLNRSRASSSTRHQDDSYMDDALNAENPGVNDIMMGAAALPPENPVGFGANLVAGARERENLCCRNYSSHRSSLGSHCSDSESAFGSAPFAFGCNLAGDDTHVSGPSYVCSPTLIVRSSTSSRSSSSSACAWSD